MEKPLVMEGVRDEAENEKWLTAVTSCSTVVKLYACFLVTSLLLQ